MRDAPVGIAFVDLEFRYLAISEWLAQAHKIPVAEHLGKTVAEVVPSDWGSLRPVFERVLQGETVVNAEISECAPTSPGRERKWLATYYPIRDDGEIMAIAWVIVDVTNEQEALREAELRSRLYQMLSSTNESIHRATSPVELYRAVCEIAVEVGGFAFAWVGAPREGEVELVASAGVDDGYLSEITITLDPTDPRSAGPTGRAFNTGTYFVVNDFLSANATEPWHEKASRVGFAASAAFPFRRRGEVVSTLTLYSRQEGYFTGDIVSTLSEITPNVSYALDRFDTEAERIEEEAALRMRDRALNAISQGIVITDALEADTPIIYASTSFLRLSGYESDEIMGRNCRFLQCPESDPEVIAEIGRAIERGEDCSVEILNQRKDGSRFWNALSISPVVDDEGGVMYFVGVQTDVTNRRSIEQQLFQAQKMEVIGSLAGGIAHDFNNILLVIRGYSRLLTTQIEDPVLRGHAERIDEAAQHAADFTRQILAFARRQPSRPEHVDLNAIVKEMLELLTQTLGASIELRLILAPGELIAMLDRSQIEQVILNLITNARDAMPDGGSLTVATSLVELGEGYAALHPGMAPVPHVLLRIADTGCGMDEETQLRVFEPFFTTKSTGTGLGLSSVQGSVDQNGGHVWLYSELGLGTTFKLYFPAGSPLDPPAERMVPDEVAPSLEGSETILIVEDNHEARRLLDWVFSSFGYSVLEAADGVEALELLEGRVDGIEMLVTDLVMPRLGGVELARRLVDRFDDLSIILTSGYSPDGLLGDPLMERCHFIEKPYALEELVAVARSMLDVRSAALAKRLEGN
jgi:PAS domain S-box-containing protein